VNKFLIDFSGSAICKGDIDLFNCISEEVVRSEYIFNRVVIYFFIILLNEKNYKKTVN
jgi:hypothetical protein